MLRALIAFLLLGLTTLQSSAATAKEVFSEYMDSNRTPILSTETNELRASGKFGFRAQLTFPESEAESIKTVSSITRLETADSVACVVTTTNGLPFSYMTDGLWIGFLDRTKPGTLAYATNGNLGWGLSGGTNEAEIVFSFQFHRGIKQPTVFLNLGRVFNPVFWEKVSYDNAAKDLILSKIE
jgi:hypothetical protein